MVNQKSKGFTKPFPHFCSLIFNGCLSSLLSLAEKVLLNFTALACQVWTYQYWREKVVINVRITFSSCSSLFLEVGAPSSPWLRRCQISSWFLKICYLDLHSRKKWFEGNESGIAKAEYQHVSGKEDIGVTGKDLKNRHIHGTHITSFLNYLESASDFDVFHMIRNPYVNRNIYTCVYALFYKAICKKGSCLI